MLKTLSIAAVIAASATASFAGSLAQAPADQIITQDEGAFVPVTGSGIGLPVILGGVLAAAAVAALVSNSNDGTDPAPED